jgi:hypothetical protein
MASTALPASPTLTGTTQAGSGIWGTVPAASDPTATAGSAIAGNLNNLSSLGALATGIDTSAAANAIMPMQNALPGLSGSLATQMGNIGQELQGQVPQDVINQLSQASAERGVQTGQGPMSPNSNANFEQALGLTSLGLENTGQQQMQSLMASIPTGAQLNESSMLVSPQEQQSAQQAANTYASAPNPSAAGNEALMVAQAGLSMGSGTLPDGSAAPGFNTAPGGAGGLPGGNTNLAATGSAGGQGGLSMSAVQAALQAAQGQLAYGDPAQSGMDWNGTDFSSLYDTAGAGFDSSGVSGQDYSSLYNEAGSASNGGGGFDITAGTYY